VGFKPTITASEQAKTVHALATVTATEQSIMFRKFERKNVMLIKATGTNSAYENLSIINTKTKTVGSGIPRSAASRFADESVESFKVHG
jgi:hypothetical protein